MTKIKKKRYIPKRFESSGISGDTSANIYNSMLFSEVWFSLSKSQQILYIYCKAQYYGEKKKPKPMYKQLTEEEQMRCFTMNKAKWCKVCRLYKDGSQRLFIHDMKALIEKGFIDLIEDGKYSRTKNIYALSDRWLENDNNTINNTN